MRIQYKIQIRSVLFTPTLTDNTCIKNVLMMSSLFVYRDAYNHSHRHKHA